MSSAPRQAAAKTIDSHRSCVLAYHGIESPGLFRQQLEDIAKGRRAAVITFDDGERSVLEYALPALVDKGLQASVFVVAGLIDSDGPFWWREVAELMQYGGRSDVLEDFTAPTEAVRHLKHIPDELRLRAIDDLRATASRQAARYPHLTSVELRDMQDAGVEIGNHSLTHPCLDRCSTEKIRHELEESQRILTGILGQAPTSIAYPNGNQDERVIEIARELGFERGYLFDHRINRRPPADPLRISRLRVNSTTPMWKFRLIVSGIHPALHHAIGRN